MELLAPAASSEAGFLATFLAFLRAMAFLVVFEEESIGGAGWAYMLATCFRLKSDSPPRTELGAGHGIPCFVLPRPGDGTWSQI